MDEAVIREHLDAAYDMALMHHGFTDYLRDYQMIIQFTGDEAAAAPPVFKQYLFTHCVSAIVISTLASGTWLESLDERLIDPDASDGLDGYVWAAGWQSLSPEGFALFGESQSARRWKAALGLPFYEAHAGANGHEIQLVFSDLRVRRLQAGYAPFTLGGPFWDGKIPLQ